MRVDGFSDGQAQPLGMRLLKAGLAEVGPEANLPTEVFVSGPGKLVSQESFASASASASKRTAAAPQLLITLQEPTKPEESPGTIAQLSSPPISAAPQGTRLETALASVAAAPPQSSLTDIPAVTRVKRRALDRLANRMKSWVGKGDIVPELRDELDKINGLEKMAQTLKTPQDFAAKTAEFKSRLAAGESLEDIRSEAYAVAREACAQALPAPAAGVRMRPFDVQMLGALAMDRGRIAEMRTGEGKTLTAVMPAYLNSLAGKGVHMITANETLAQRDSAQMAPVYSLLGVRVATVLEDMSSDQKRDGYSADITYTTNSTLGFDHLRDRNCRDAGLRVQRPPFFALVDEVDEVLIDEARTPLILSAASEPVRGLYQTMSSVVSDLVPGEDFQVDLQKHVSFLTESGQDVVANELGMKKSQGHLSRALSIARQSIRDIGSAPTPAAKEKIQRRLDRASALAERAHELIDQGQKLRPAIRKEAKLAHDLEIYSAHKKSPMANLKDKLGDFFRLGQSEDAPVFDSAVEAAKKTELEAAQAGKNQLLKGMPVVNIYHPSQIAKVSYMQKALDAHSLFSMDKDYTIAYSEKLEKSLLSFCKNEIQIAPSEHNQTKVLLAAQMLEPQVAHRLGRAPSDNPAWITENLQGETAAALGQILKEQGSSVPEYLDQLVVDKAKKAGLTPEAQLGVTKREHAELKIIDEFKGRVADGRRFNDGLHQALEAKEGIKIGAEQRSVASITYPNLFRRYPRLAGMSGTAKVAEKEFQQLYNLDVAVIPTHRPIQMKQEPDLVFRTLEEKYQAVVGEAQRCYEEGIPLLIGTRSGEVNKQLVGLLQNAGVPCQALNADNIKHNTDKENALLAHAGLSGWVTVATNMAGRGVDIKEDQASYKRVCLVASQFSNPDLVTLYHNDMAKPEEAAAWNKFLTLCKIDPQEFAARAGEAQKAGQTGLPVVIDVDKPQEAERLAEWFNTAVPYKILQPGEKAPAAPGQVQIRVKDGSAPPAGSLRLKLSDFPTGGLRVAGTERHTSPRIDDQLTGRSARQGRPGTARFYLSLQDELLKIYGGDALGKVLDLVGTAPGEGVSHPALAKFVASCQSKIESANYDMRAETTKYDGILNQHRDLFYELHEAVVNSNPQAPAGAAEKVDLHEMACDWAVDALVLATKMELPENVGKNLDPDELDKATKGKHTASEVQSAMTRAAQKLGLPIKVELDSPASPATVLLDGDKKVRTDALQDLVRPAIDGAYQTLRSGASDSDRQDMDHDEFVYMLNAMDSAWTDHLEIMDSLRGSANLLSYAQKDPFKEYQRMAVSAFRQTVETFKAEAASHIFKSTVKA